MRTRSKRLSQEIAALARDANPLAPGPGARLYASGAPEADLDAVAVDDHRHGAAAFAVGEHALQLGRVFLDVDVFDRNVPPLIVSPGGLRVGSGVLAEDVDHAVIVAR